MPSPGKVCYSKAAYRRSDGITARYDIHVHRSEAATLMKNDKSFKMAKPSASVEAPVTSNGFRNRR